MLHLIPSADEPMTSPETSSTWGAEATAVAQVAAFVRARALELPADSPLRGNLLDAASSYQAIAQLRGARKPLASVTA